MTDKVIIYGLDGKEKSTAELPNLFSIRPRIDLVSRAVTSLELSTKQPQGRDPLAGMRNTARSWGSGFGTSRFPRRKGSGYPGARNAAFVPGAVGGRLPHPPRTIKVLTKHVNTKERHLALLNAISATANKELVSSRGHLISKIPSLPLVVDDKIQTIKKTSDVLEVFEKLGLFEDVQRVKDGLSIRAGKGKSRGRKFKRKKSILVVIKDNFGIYNAARNIAGVDIVNISSLNCSDLAPGAKLGRLTLWVESAFNRLNKMGGN